MNDEAMLIVRELAAIDPTCDNGFPWLDVCVLCGGNGDHDDNCAWLRACRLVAQVDGAPVTPDTDA